MRTALLRGLSAALLTVLSLTTGTPAHAAETVPLADAVASLPLATESRDGYTREAFKHWTAGDDPADGCTTRNEVLIAEAVEAPAVGPRCRLTGGSWWSYYDQTAVTSASGLDIDHMVPLAEAWDSGASAWTAQRREAYANDLVPRPAWSRSPPAPTAARPTRTPPSGCPRPPTSTAGMPLNGPAPSSAGTSA